MANQRYPIHDFGLLPEYLAPPAGTIRTQSGPGRVVAVYVIVYGLLVLGLSLTSLIASTTPWPLNWLSLAACLTSIAALMYLGMRNDYRWIELDGSTLRARRLYTWSTTERPIELVESLVTIYHAGTEVPTTVLNNVFGRIKGVEVRFRDHRTPLRIYRADPAMVNAEEFLTGVLYRMTEIGTLEADIADVDDRPLVRSIHWQGEPASEPWKNVEALRGIVLFAVASFGVVLSYWYVQLHERVVVGSRPPHVITLAELLKNGPGENRHVTVTEFEPGGFSYEAEGSSWKQAWVAIFPQGTRRTEIQAIVSTGAARNEADLNRILQPRRITGVCSVAPQTGWGMTLGPNLVSANGDLPLNAAWHISEMRRPPPAELVEALRFAASGILVLAIVMSLFHIGRGILTGK